MSAYMAAFNELMACSTIFKNGLEGGNFLSSVLGPGLPRSW